MKHEVYSIKIVHSDGTFDLLRAGELCAPATIHYFYEGCIREYRLANVIGGVVEYLPTGLVEL